MKAIGLALLFLASVGSVSVAHAEDSFLISQLQKDLGHLGYDVGKADGAIGKKTKEAIADFKKKSGMPANATIIDIVFKVQQLSRNVYEITDEDKRATISDIEKKLKDPYSAHYYWSNGWSHKDDGVTWICGMVNAKNSYGGYVGKTPFMAMLYGTKDGPRGSFAILYDSKASERLFTYNGCVAP